MSFPQPHFEFHKQCKVKLDSITSAANMYVRKILTIEYIQATWYLETSKWKFYEQWQVLTGLKGEKRENKGLNQNFADFHGQVPSHTEDGGHFHHRCHCSNYQGLWLVCATQFGPRLHSKGVERQFHEGEQMWWNFFLMKLISFCFWLASDNRVVFFLPFIYRNKAEWEKKKW